VIIFWIFTLFVGSSAFAVAYIYFQYPEDMPAVPDERDVAAAMTGSA
jgi:hypothetical protein